VETSNLTILPLSLLEEGLGIYGKCKQDLTPKPDEKGSRRRPRRRMDNNLQIYVEAIACKRGQGSSALC
jgi:hypothetical protein